MDFDETNAIAKPVFWAIVVLFLVAVVLLMIWVMPKRHDRQSGSPTTPLGLNYTKTICDDSDRELHYEKTNPPHIDIPLREGCFSGFVGLPDGWDNWQGQMYQAHDGDWVSEWYSGVSEPAGPYTAMQINTGTVRVNIGPVKQLRVQGKGTLRLYRLNGDTHGSASDVAVPGPRPEAEAILSRPDPPPISPTSGADAQYALALEECSRHGEEIKCWGYITNKTDAATKAWVHRASAVDDEGNSLSGDASIGDAPTIKLIPGVKTRYALTYKEPHMNVKAITLQFQVHFEPNNGDVVFKNIPVE